MATATVPAPIPLHRGSPALWGDLNPRYVSYCLAHGHRTPAQARAADETAWPGGVMCGFMLWIADQIAAFKRAQRLPPREPLDPAQQDAFTRYLAALPLPADAVAHAEAA